MRKSDALALGRQLGIEVRTVNQFSDEIDRRGWHIGLDNVTGNWVIVMNPNTPDEKVLARV